MRFFPKLRSIFSSFYFYCRAWSSAKTKISFLIDILRYSDWISQPVELLNLAWSKPKLKHKAPNVLTMIERFNVVSSWVATMIISPDRVKNRTRAITKFLKLAKHLRQLNNFNSLTGQFIMFYIYRRFVWWRHTAVIAAFNMASVHRLKFSWEGVPANLVEVNLVNLMFYSEETSSCGFAVTTCGKACWCCAASSLCMA